VVGYASSSLFDKTDPFNPVNRRIDIVVLTKKAQKAIEGEQGSDDAPPATTPTEGQGAPGEVPADPNAVPADKQPLPAHEVRQRLNIFEDGVLKMDEPGKPKTGS